MDRLPLGSLDHHIDDQPGDMTGVMLLSEERSRYNGNGQRCH